MMSFTDMMRHAELQKERSKAELEYLKAKQKYDEQIKNKELIERNRTRVQPPPKRPEKKEQTLSSALSSFKIPRKVDGDQAKHAPDMDKKHISSSGSASSSKIPDRKPSTADARKPSNASTGKNVGSKDVSRLPPKSAGKPMVARVNDDMLDLLSSAKHVSKPVNPPPVEIRKPVMKPSAPVVAKNNMSAKTTSMSSSSKNKGPSSSGSTKKPVVSGNDRKRPNDYTTGKPPPMKRPPPPTSFEEMMRLAKENANKDFSIAGAAKPAPQKKEYQSATAGLNFKKESKSKSAFPEPKSRLLPGDARNQMSSSSKSKFSNDSRSQLTSSSSKSKPLPPDPRSSKSSFPMSSKSKPLPDSRNKPAFPDSRNKSTFPDSRSKPSFDSRPKPSFDPRNKSSFSDLKSKSSKQAPPRIKESASKQYGSSSKHDPFDKFKRPGYPPKPLPPPRRAYSDDYDDDDEDSLDDFIDDDMDDSYQSRSELSKVLKSFCRSDQDTWKRREREIDISRMHADYRTIEAEDRRSAMVARMEDMLEEKRGAHKLG